MYSYIFVMLLGREDARYPAHCEALIVRTLAVSLLNCNLIVFCKLGSRLGVSSSADVFRRGRRYRQPLRGQLGRHTEVKCPVLGKTKEQRRWFDALYFGNVPFTDTKPNQPIAAREKMGLANAVTN